MIAVRPISPSQAADYRAALVGLLMDAVESGAAVNFVWPMTRDKAGRWWDGAFASHFKGERLIFVAQQSAEVVGTVQLILAPQENQSFRAEIAKMIVHSKFRRQGIGASLMQSAEEEARRAGRTLLTLDTRSGEAGERLYARMGWIKFGEVPNYADNPDLQGRHGASFYYKAL